MSYLGSLNTNWLAPWNVQAAQAAARDNTAMKARVAAARAAEQASRPKRPIEIRPERFPDDWVPLYETPYAQARREAEFNRHQPITVAPWSQTPAPTPYTPSYAYDARGQSMAHNRDPIPSVPQKYFPPVRLSPVRQAPTPSPAADVYKNLVARRWLPGALPSTTASVLKGVGEDDAPWNVLRLIGLAGLLYLMVKE